VPRPSRLPRLARGRLPRLAPAMPSLRQMRRPPTGP